MYNHDQRNWKHTEYASTKKHQRSETFPRISWLLSKICTLLPRHHMLTQQTNSKDQIFKWRELCQAAFKMLKEKLCHEPILKYPDTMKPYTLFMDASNYGWAEVLTQECNSTNANGNQCSTLQPVAYISGLFRGSQLNWAAFTKEAYAIYMCVKHLTFYISETKVTLRSDHLPLKKFFQEHP